MTTIERFIEWGSNIVGTAAGGLAGQITAGPAGAVGGMVAGAFVGETIAPVLSEIGQRVLSTRQKERVGAVSILATNMLQEALANGSRLRGDAFLRARADGRSPAAEVIEHVMLAAQSSFEERKLPHLAAALTSIALAEHVDERTAHWIVGTLERLSWTKLVALALIDDQELNPLPPLDVGTHPETWGPWSAHTIFHELIYSDILASQTGPARTDGEFGAPIFTKRFSDLGLTTGGSLIVQAGDLASIIPNDREELRRSISAVSG